MNLGEDRNFIVIFPAMDVIDFFNSVAILIPVLGVSQQFDGVAGNWLV